MICPEVAIYFKSVNSLFLSVLLYNEFHYLSGHCCLLPYLSGNMHLKTQKGTEFKSHLSSSKDNSHHLPSLCLCQLHSSPLWLA